MAGADVGCGTGSSGVTLVCGATFFNFASAVGLTNFSGVDVSLSAA